MGENLILLILFNIAKSTIFMILSKCPLPLIGSNISFISSSEGRLKNMFDNTSGGFL